MERDLVGRTLGPGGRYRIVAPLASGGMGTVYRAEDTVLEREVALKVLNPALAGTPDFVERFRREARAVARLEHDHIVPVHDFGEEGPDGSLCFLVMRLLRGGTLGDRLKTQQGQPWTTAEALSLARQALAALAYAHERGVVHRDVKPANFLVEAGRVYLADFGIAKLAQAEDGAGRGFANVLQLTRSGAGGIGTPAYMAPEQVRGQPVDGRVDQYAFGAVLFELLTGQPPYHGDTPWEIWLQHVEAPVPSATAVNAGVPPEVDAVLARALAKAPDDRFPTALHFLEALEVAVNGGAADAPAIPASTVFSPPATLQMPAPAVPAVVVTRASTTTWWRPSGRSVTLLTAGGVPALVAIAILLRGLGFPELPLSAPPAVVGVSVGPTPTVAGAAPMVQGTAPPVLPATPTALPAVVLPTPAAEPESAPAIAELAPEAPAAEPTAPAPTAEPPTPVPPTAVPATPTVGPATSTVAPVTQTAVPATAIPPTATLAPSPVPLTEASPTGAAPTAIPQPTEIPATPVPPTPEPTAVPPTAIPATALPPSPVPATPVPPSVTPSGSSLTIGGPRVVLTTGARDEKANATFSGAANQRVVVKWRDATFDVGNIELFAPDGRTRVWSGSGAIGLGQPGMSSMVTLPIAGTYTVVVSPWNNQLRTSGSVAVEAIDIPPDPTGTITVGGAPVTASTTVQDQRVRLALNGTANQRVVVKWRDATFDVGNVELFAPDGRTGVWSGSGAIGRGQIGTGAMVTLPISGTYTLVVSPWNNQLRTSGSVIVEVMDIPPDPTGTITVGGPPVTVSTTVRDQRVRLSLSGVADQRVVVKWRDATFDVGNIELFAPDGRTGVWSGSGAIGRGQAGTGAVVTLPVAGTYTLVVSPWNNQLRTSGSVTVEVANG